MLNLIKNNDKAILTMYGYIGGYIDFRSVKEALDEITNSGISKVDIRFHSYGGSVIDGNLIYNFISEFAGEIEIYIDGVAASMGSIIMMAGKRTHIAENGFVMIHCPVMAAEGNKKVFQQNATLLDSIENNFKKKFIEKTGKPDTFVNAWFEGGDFWFSAEDALQIGLVDSIFSPKTKDIKTLDKAQAAQMGAKAVYEMYNLATDTITNLNTKNMNKAELIARYKLTNVTEASTDEDIMAAIDAKIAESQATAQTAVNNSIELAVDNAIAAKKISATQKEFYMSIGKNSGLQALNRVFGDMNPYNPITNQINNGANGKQGVDKTDWTFDDYQLKAAAELESMPTANPALFKQLYKDKFGVEPK